MLRRRASGGADAFECARHPVDHLLGADDHRHGQVCLAHHARRQSRRGRDTRADGARLARPRQPGPAPVVAGRIRDLRRGHVLRRRHDHAGDLRAGCGRRSGDHRAGAPSVHRPRDGGDRRRLVRDPEARHCERRPLVRPGDVCLVRRAGAARCVAAGGAPGGAVRAQSNARRRLRFQQSAPRVSGAGRDRPRGHGHRGALCRHGTLRRLRPSGAHGSGS